MAAEENKTIAQRFGADVWGRGDLAAADELLAEELVEHNPLPGQGPGRAGHKQILQAFRTAFPDLRVTNDDVLVDGDKAVLRWTGRGTHRGELMGIPPTGKAVTMTGIDILRIAGGQIVERWAETNSLEVMQQLGAVPAPK